MGRPSISDSTTRAFSFFKLRRLGNTRREAQASEHLRFFAISFTRLRFGLVLGLTQFEKAKDPDFTTACLPSRNSQSFPQG
jgi:hypothetical protein